VSGVSTRSSWGFGWGVAAGIALALVALLTTQPNPAATPDGAVAAWLQRNLGHSVWFFAIVIVLFGLKLRRLMELLHDKDAEHDAREVVELDQMLDVWIQVFVGIGVIWTAVGMRSALQAALGDPGAALTDTAGNVLRKLVDGGILLALTTTIVGAVGGYVMRLIKTAVAGARLQGYYEATERQEIKALLEAAHRIESHLESMSASESNVTLLQGTPGEVSAPPRAR